MSPLVVVRPTNDAIIDDRIFDIVSMACSNQPLKVTHHEEYKKLSKGDIDVLVSSKSHQVVIDRRLNGIHSIFANIEQADYNMSKSV